jgi:hypothetical protein
MASGKSNRKELSIHTLDFTLLKKDFRSKKSSKVTPLKGDVQFVSVKPTEEEWEVPRTWAARIFRGEQKCQYKILFKLFPQLVDSRG